ncbi:hypothetical protein ACKKBG_A21410 [Auxenochlorella protothecoides x Auxenochlorella symbiontica]
MRGISLCMNGPCPGTSNLRTAAHLQGRLHIGTRCRRLQGSRRIMTRANAEALDKGRELYEKNDRMGALRAWEAGMASKGASSEERGVMAYNAACVHAYFGDVEPAQVAMREAVGQGLDLLAALESGDKRLVQLQASPQVQRQLEKFILATLEGQKKKAAATSPPKFGSASGEAGGKSGGSWSGPKPSGVLERDVSDMLSTDIQGIDKSVLGIIRRVLILVAVLVFFGVGLFYLGLNSWLGPQ